MGAAAHEGLCMWMLCFGYRMSELDMCLGLKGVGCLLFVSLEFVVLQAAMGTSLLVSLVVPQ